jgi:N,N'-diacetyllegionaminate synthase
MKIIAESAYNHNGSMEMLKQLADASKKANADFFTFQVMNVDEFCTEDYSKREIYDNNSFSEKQWEELFDYCTTIKLNAIPCVLDIASFNLCYKYGYRLFKIHGTDITNDLFLKTIIDTEDSKVILETQCSTLVEINYGHRILGSSLEAIFGGYSNYPTEIEDFNLNSIHELKKFGCKVGYADHTTDTSEIPLMILSKGYDYIEKHITITRNNRNFDWQVSLYPEQFSSMVNIIRHYSRALGNTCKHPSKNEMAYRNIISKKKLADGSIKRSNSGCNQIKHLINLFPRDNIHVGIIARLSSTRFPLKVLQNFNGKPMIEQLYKRLTFNCMKVNKVSLLTSYETSDNKLAKIFLNTFRGHPESVIDRMLEYAFLEKAGAIFRVTGDNPYTDPELIDKMCKLYLDNNLDYVRVNGLPFGVTAELYKTTYLWNLYLSMVNTFESEYLTWFVLLDKNVRRGCLDLVNENSQINNVNLSVDYQEDLQQCKELLSKINVDDFKNVTLKNIIDNSHTLPRVDVNKSIKLPNNTSIKLSEYLSMHHNAEYIVRETIDI